MLRDYGVQNFVCSRQFLYKDTRAVQSRSAASSHSPKTVSIIAWLQAYKEYLDVMPDEGGWYMVPHSRRRYLYREYVQDSDARPALYSPCTKAWFCSVWREHFPELRLRKFHRFTKCTFCVRCRSTLSDRKLSEAVRLEAKVRLKQHIAWANKRERGHYKFKRTIAIEDPARAISVSIDGTDKFDHGFPHFFEITKNDDSVRLKVNVVCVMVHGTNPYIYIGWEHLFSDPNLVCEVLTRTLRREEGKRGVLPPNLFLQLDNCWRENKNTYVEKYLEFFVERGIHAQVLPSFLPKGHTHFDCDQLASRIGEVSKHRDIKSVKALVEVLRHCYSPKPHVEFIHDVMDWKRVINPEHPKEFPVGTAMCRQMRGLCTKSLPSQEQAFYMDETSPLHWRIRADPQGHVFLQTRHTIDTPDDQWSEPVYHWDTNAPRPQGRARASTRESGLKVSDLKIAPFRVLKERRLGELKSALEGVRTRLTEEEATEMDGIFDLLESPPAVESLPCPDNRWSFTNEGYYRNGNQGEVIAPEELHMPTQSIYHNLNEQNQARQFRNEGVDTSKVCAGNFIAYTVDYTDDVAPEDRNEFWLGAVIEIDKETHSVKVRQYHTGTKNNATHERNPATYKMWSGLNQTTWLTKDRLLLKFERLTGGGRVSKASLRRIAGNLAAKQAGQSDDILNV